MPPVNTTPPYSSFLMSTSHLAIVSRTMPTQQTTFETQLAACDKACRTADISNHKRAECEKEHAAYHRWLTSSSVRINRCAWQTQTRQPRARTSRRSATRGSDPCNTTPCRDALWTPDRLVPSYVFTVSRPLYDDRRLCAAMHV